MQRSRTKSKLFLIRLVVIRVKRMLDCSGVV